MRDLEIRGAGSILGASQSGHLANVGYDMYLQLLDEAVREERGEKDVHKEECLVDIKIDAYIPEDYISNQAQRVDCYRKIAKIQNDEDSTDVTDELIDRYGNPPKSVVGLIEVARLRNMASACNIVEISQMKNDLRSESCPNLTWKRLRLCRTFIRTVSGWSRPARGIYAFRSIRAKSPLFDVMRTCSSQP